MTATKGIAGVAGLFTAVPASYGIYHIWDTSNPTGRARLEKSGLQFRQPAFTSNWIDSYVCANNLFKKTQNTNTKPSSSDNKLYGCAAIVLEEDSEKRLTNLKADIAMKQGTKGWIFNIIDIGSNEIRYAYTELSYSDNKWTQEAWTWPETATNTGGGNPGNKKLIIKVPNKDNTSSDTLWDSPMNKDSLSRDKGPTVTTQNFFKVWISEGTGGSDENWMLKHMMVAIESEDKSNMFCSKSNSDISKSKCFENSNTQASKMGSGSSESFTLAEFSSSGTVDSSARTNVSKEKIKKAYQELSKSKGSWYELSEICSYEKDRNISEDKQKHLDLFCASDIKDERYPRPNLPLPLPGPTHITP